MNLFKIEKKITLSGLLIFALLPFLLLKVIQPEWLGRLIAIGIFYIPILCFLVLIVNTKSVCTEKELNKDLFKTLDSREKVAKRINIGVRILSATLVIFGVFYLFIPYIKSISFLVAGKQPLVYIGILTERGGTISPFSNFYHESLSFDGEKKTDNFFQLDFHRPLKSNSRYQFTYIPETRLILEIKELP